MSEATQNWPVGLTPIPGSPSSLRVRPVPCAGGRGLVTQVVWVLAAAAAGSEAVTGATASSTTPVASSSRVERAVMRMEPSAVILGARLRGRTPRYLPNSDDMPIG